MKAWNKKRKPKFHTKTKIIKYYGVVIYCRIMKPKKEYFDYIKRKKSKIPKIILVWIPYKD